MPEKTATRQLILEAAVACIEKYGIDKVTTRKIAQEAGTNIASINYYFRSKDELLEETLSMTIKHMMEDVFLAIDDTKLPFEECLKSVMLYLLSGTQQFPGISRAHLYRAVFGQDRKSISAQAMKQVFERLTKRATQEYPSEDPKRLRFVVAEIMSSILFSMLSPTFFPVSREYQLTSAKNAATLAEAYVALFKAMVRC